MFEPVQKSASSCKNLKIFLKLKQKFDKCKMEFNSIRILLIFKQFYFLAFNQA